MRIGNVVARIKAALTLTPVRSWANSFWGIIREPFAGAWQKNVECESTQNILAFSAVYACISLIAGDIAKLRAKLVELLDTGIWKEVISGSPFLLVLRKPNRFQTRIQFFEQWIVSKLLHGNAYILKERESVRGVVRALYVLDPRLVTPLVAEDGGVYYQLKVDHLAGLTEGVTIPASEIIHDRMLCLWHPLIGVSPIYACGASSTQGIRIQANSARFFENMSRPSGHLTAPGAITDENVARLKKEFEANFSGGNIGRLLVTGDGLKYEAMTIPAQDAQLIEQLRWTVEDVARCFHVPLHKLGVGQPTLNNIGSLNQDYYSQCLQGLIEAIELLLDEGLELVNVPGKTLGMEFDTAVGLLRMDPKSRAETNAIRIGCAELAPNEARQSEDLEPVEGGESPYLQQQNWQLKQLAKRTPPADAPTPPQTPAAPPEKPDDDEAVKAFLEHVRAGFQIEHA